MNKRRGYPDIPSAIAGGIAQMERVEVVGYARSVEDANLRHVAACEAMARSNTKSREMMDRLRNNIKPKPLTADEMSELYYPKRRIK